jgi:FkbM family methyltransferase
MPGKITSALWRWKQRIEYAGAMLDQIRKTWAIETNIENQNAILFGITEMMKKLNELDRVRVEIGKASQLMNVTATELRAFNAFSETLSRRFAAIENELVHLGAFYDRHGTSFGEAFASLKPVLEDLDRRYHRAADIARLAAGAPQAFLGITGEESSVVESIAQFKAEAELALMQHLFPYLSSRAALDIGANKGVTSACLVRTGFDVYAFEPFPAAYREIETRLAGEAGFHLLKIGVGASDDSLELFSVEAEGERFAGVDTTLFSTFVKHDLPAGLAYGAATRVPVRSIESLIAAGEIPREIGLVKIDTEGGDLAVISGMGEARFDVVISESWAEGSALAGAASPNPLPAIAAAMRERGYPYLIHIFRRDGTTEPAHFVNWDRQHRGSWGNTFFFRSAPVFHAAANWCERYVPRAPVPAD